MEQIQNKIDEKFKLIEEQQEDMKSNSDSIRLLRKFPDTPVAKDLTSQIFSRKRRFSLRIQLKPLL